MKIDSGNGEFRLKLCLKYIYFNLNFNSVSRFTSQNINGSLISQFYSREREREAYKVSGMSKYQIRFLAHISKVERQQIFEGTF